MNFDSKINKLLKYNFNAENKKTKKQEKKDSSLNFHKLLVEVPRNFFTRLISQLRFLLMLKMFFIFSEFFNFEDSPIL